MTREAWFTAEELAVWAFCVALGIVAGLLLAVYL